MADENLRDLSELREHWALEPGVIYLNHGSFGACPRSVLDVQHRLRERMERQPVKFFVRDLEGLLDAARAELAAFLSVEARNVAFVPNATSGVNAVLRSLRLGAGDELLTTNHEYNACRNALQYVAQRAGARVVVASLPFPIGSIDEVVEAVLDRVGPRTRLALLDHVTSQTGMVLPIARLVRELAHRRVDTLVDGAHAPGMLDLDVGVLGAAYYTGNCHKWLCAPKGAGFLHVRPDLQAAIHPAVTSHGANSTRRDRSRFLIEFDWTGTDDPTAALCVPDAIGFVGGLLPGGWPELREHNRSLTLRGRRLLCAALGIEPPCPDEMIGSLAALPLPPGAVSGAAQPPGSALYGDPLQDELLSGWSIEVPVIPWPAPPRRLVRISGQVYNRPQDYEVLAGALRHFFW